MFLGPVLLWIIFLWGCIFTYLSHNFRSFNKIHLGSLHYFNSERHHFKRDWHCDIISLVGRDAMSCTGIFPQCNLDTGGFERLQSNGWRSGCMWWSRISDVEGPMGAGFDGTADNSKARFDSNNMIGSWRSRLDLLALTDRVSAWEEGNSEHDVWLNFC